MNFSDNELKDLMQALYAELLDQKSNKKLVIAKAVAAGMKYQEEKIKAGINVVFENLSLPVPS